MKWNSIVIKRIAHKFSRYAGTSYSLIFPFEIWIVFVDLFY